MNPAAKEIRLSALDMNCVSFLSQGMWRHPNDQVAEGYKQARYWVDYARKLESGLFDLLFLADSIAVPEVYGGSHAAAVETGAHVPANDPFPLLPLMAYSTDNLCFGVTGNASYEVPYLFARRISTLDHLMNGRIAWNVVTGSQDSAARAMGRRSVARHDDRYEAADEFMDVMYKLWESGWEAGSVLRDRAAGIFADPSKVHRVRHESERFALDAVYLAEPSPQRTPVIFQAGASPRGRSFAAKHAECIFVNGQSAPKMAQLVADTRRLAETTGRDPAHVLFFAGVCIVVGRTEKEAQEKYRDYMRYNDPKATLAVMSASLQIDLSQYPLDEIIEYRENDGNRTAMENITRRGDRNWTIRQVIDEMALSSMNLLIVGTPAQIADRMIAWMAETGVDGFNIGRTVMPEMLDDFIALVVPELQARGMYKTAYRKGTLREKLGLSEDGLLPANHAGAQFRIART